MQTTNFNIHLISTTTDIEAYNIDTDKRLHVNKSIYDILLCTIVHFNIFFQRCKATTNIKFLVIEIANNDCFQIANKQILRIAK